MAVNDESMRMSIEPVAAPRIDVSSTNSVFSWPYVIENYSKLSNDVGKGKLSPLFGIGNYEFQIQIFPGGDAKDTEGYLSVFLKLWNPSHGVIEFTFSILDHNGNKRFSYPRLVRHEYDLSLPNKRNPYGLRKFLKFSPVLENILASTDDQLIILCEISDLNATESTYELQKVCTNKEYFNNEQFSDFKFIIEDKKVPAHKIILATTNEIFAAMVKDDIINIDDVEYEVFMELIRFIYTGQVHNIEKFAKKLVITANKYGVVQLRHKCERYLCPLLTTSNTLELLQLGDQCGLEELKKDAISFFVTNRKTIMASDCFKTQIELLRPGLTADLMMGFTSL